MAEFLNISIVLKYRCIVISTTNLSENITKYVGGTFPFYKVSNFFDVLLFSSTSKEKKFYTPSVQLQECSATNFHHKAIIFFLFTPYILSYTQDERTINNTL